MKSSEIRERFLTFFKKRGHAIIPSASLVTPDEKGITNPTLFNTAGMQPLIPYLLGKPHPEGKRLVDVQKCVRTVDIDDIGDKTHATFFEMLGNWSLGDYFKKEAIEWSYDFLTSKDEGLGLDPKRLYVTVFEGDENAERDEEAANIWHEIFRKNKIEGSRVFYLGAEQNWWQAGDNGPCGPDTEMFYDVANRFKGKGITHAEFFDADQKRDVLEIWNDVFMQYEKKDGKIIGRLPAPSVDTGAGLERLTMTMQGVDNIYDTDLLKPVMDLMAKAQNSLESKRIIADHLRASVFLIADGVVPSNTDRGYILRRLIRRAIINTTDKILDEGRVSKFADTIVGVYGDHYPELRTNSEDIKKVLLDESVHFSKALTHALRKFEEYKNGGMTLTADDVFILYSSYGMPVQMTLELAKEHNVLIYIDGLEEKIKKHQELSRTGAEKKFKGGLADTSEMSVKYHTATHLLHQALHDVLGEGVMQKGSNITPERLRFDFSHARKMTEEEKKKVEDIVNEKIKADLPVQNVVMSKAEAEKTGARHFFGEKYGDEVSIYFVGKDLQSAYSKEFCGGPHVMHTGGLGKFKIQKEEAVSQGIRRIKAVLE
jgi:alanyl-tRNA synthetase